jgi:hypothetical protein
VVRDSRRALARDKPVRTRNKANRPRPEDNRKVDNSRADKPHKAADKDPSLVRTISSPVKVARVHPRVNQARATKEDRVQKVEDDRAGTASGRIECFSG